MPRQYTQEQLEKIYEKLPEELKEAIFAVETANTISDIGEQYGIEDERLNKIAEYTGYVLMGLILPQEFSQIIETELKLPKTLSESIARDINRMIFYPVKPALEQLHRMEIEVTAKVVTPQPPGTTEEKVPQEKPEERKGPDIYREPIE